MKTEFLQHTDGGQQLSNLEKSYRNTDTLIICQIQTSNELMQHLSGCVSLLCSSAGLIKKIPHQKTVLR